MALDFELASTCSMLHIASHERVHGGSGCSCLSRYDSPFPGQSRCIRDNSSQCLTWRCMLPGHCSCQIHIVGTPSASTFCFPRERHITSWLSLLPFWSTAPTDERLDNEPMVCFILGVFSGHTNLMCTGTSLAAGSDAKLMGRTKAGSASTVQIEAHGRVCITLTL